FKGDESMKRLSVAVAIAFAVLILRSDLVTAQHGRGSGGPAGPPPMSERGQMPDRSNRTPREPREPGSVNHDKPKRTDSDQLDKNTQLATRLQGMFPPGTDLKLASSGFKNLGQFVAATQVSKNLGIPFDQLKARMTGDNPVSLGKAIKELRPDA